MSDVFLLIVDIRHPVSGCNLEFGFHFNAYNRCLFFLFFHFYLFICLLMTCPCWFPHQLPLVRLLRLEIQCK